MCQVNVFQAKTELSKLLVKLENHEENEIIIARNGKPVAKLVLFEQASVSRRIGAAKGIFSVPASIDEDNDATARLFSGLIQ